VAQPPPDALTNEDTSMNRLHRIAAIGFASLLLCGPAVADPRESAEMQPPATARKISAFTCKDVMRMDGSDRDVAVAFLHGYLLGEKKSDDFDTHALSDATDRFIDTCLDHPKRMAIDVMREATK
jgi:hypothetical protein